MAATRKTRRLKTKATRTWGKPPIKPPSLKAGEIKNELKVIVPDTGKRENGHRLALVEDVVTGERREVRAANVVSGNTKSAGRIKKERFKERKAKSEAAKFMDLDSIDPELVDAARRLRGSDVDASSGECVSAVRQKEGDVWTVPNPADPRIPTEFMILKGKKLRQDKSTGCNWLPNGTTVPKSQSVKVPTAAESMKAPEPQLEDKLRALIPYLDVKNGIVTFGRVRNDMRHIDGRSVRELLESAGIIDAKLNLTGKGKTWLLQHESNGDRPGRTTDV
jgi:hypothetical protein